MRNYVVIYEPGPTSWGAYVPDLPGCFAAAETRTEVERLISEAIPFHIRGLVADGDLVPEPVAEVGIVAIAA